MRYKVLNDRKSELKKGIKVITIKLLDFGIHLSFEDLSSIFMLFEGKIKSYR
jgi:hypothetical protein